ncbi:hypothetical protein UP09_29385 [Bradyrhizobium sp. LTSP885]|uniref:DUF4145 domain-containing protein n=1 Tax=Bradyrhizobium sp. LTSP885 TaxID=1619232 RepID=UPI0005CB1063|nr:DUF4145 domain-containing protein [Bradyrhizobium sp. LTSP885]KJC35393.1 hypothetical protein UP09_29385 [Bradyrhizobium sp. LTSP885]
MTQFNWTCPHCSRRQIATEANRHADLNYLYLTPLDLGDVGVKLVAYSCLNNNCKKLTLYAYLHEWINRAGPGQNKFGDQIREWRLLPESSAIPQPDCIPRPLVADYYEACRIRDLSPKASATLARRCLQGMIRDFCGIAKGTLDAEIKELRTKIDSGQAPAGVTHESAEAIDQVRSIGNIGAHMERDINLIVEVDPGEAQALIELIEMLFEEWYVARHNRRHRLAKIAAIAADKKAKIAEGKAELTKNAAREPTRE